MDEATEKSVEEMIDRFAGAVREHQARSHEFAMSLLSAYEDMLGEFAEVMGRAVDRGEFETAREIGAAIEASLQRVTGLVKS